MLTMRAAHWPSKAGSAENGLWRTKEERCSDLLGILGSSWGCAEDHGHLLAICVWTGLGVAKARTGQGVWRRRRRGGHCVRRR